jgi:hypothetical protein
LPFLFSEASAEFRDKVQAVEDRADDCYQLLRLLKRPRNLAAWALLTRMALGLERTLQEYGANSPRHRMAVINLDLCTCGFKFIAVHCKPESRLAEKYTWHGSIAQDAGDALDLCIKYNHFLNVFPMWHKNHEQVDLLPEGQVRFHIPRDSPRQRQAIAYKHIFRPSEEEYRPWGSVRTSESPDATRLLGELVHHVRPAGLPGKFKYEPSLELIDALRPKYQERLDENFRHPDSFQLNGYSLHEFKSFYVALLILCAIHENICYPWKENGHPIPVSSLVMVKKRVVWNAKLSEISKIPIATCDKIVSDLTLDALTKPYSSMCIHPFVPIDKHFNTLAVAPQFPLASAVDENILRSFSHLSPALFSAQNTRKEAVMIERIRNANSRYRLEFSIGLPDKSTEIDALFEDEASSTVILAELKWIRKPGRPLEQIARDAEVEKGISQLSLIRAYSRREPDFLRARGKLALPLTSYANVHYLLLARDYWFWIDPDDEIAIVDFDVFLTAFESGNNLQEFVAGLLKYDWLPVEGRDFHVTYEASGVNGAVMESAIFKPAR